MMRRFILALTLLVGGATSADAAAARYWRIQCVTEGALCVFTEVELHTSIGGSQAATGGTASASTTLGAFVPALAFDGNTSTFWASANTAPPHWIAYDMGSGNSIDVVEVKLYPRGGGDENQSPRWIYIESSSDGSTWTTRWTAVAATWVASTPQTFAKPATLTSNGGHRWWRVDVHRTQSQGAVGFSNIAMAATSGGTNLLPGALPDASGYFGALYPWNGNDSNTTTSDWAIASAPSQWWSADLLSGNSQPVTEVKITARNASPGSGNDQAPLRFCTKYSDDGSTWVTSWCSISTGAWTSNEVRTFLRPSYADALTGGHRCWRVVGATAQDASNIMAGSKVTLYIAGNNEVMAWAEPTVDSTTTGSGYNLTDADTTTIWASANTAYPHYVQFDFGTEFAPSIRRVAWTSRNDSSFAQAPATGSLQYSDDCSSWTTYVSYSVSWTQNQTQDLVNVPSGGARGYIFGANDNWPRVLIREDRCEIAA